MADRESGRPRGFGFVDFSSDGEAEKAISLLNGYTLGNREIVVNEARPPDLHPPIDRLSLPIFL